MSFKLIETTQSGIRKGILKTAHGEINTPFFMPIATKGAVKTLSSFDMDSLGADILLSNTYHLYLRPGMDVMKAAGGLHNFMRWNKPILTDSGGYQVFSLSKIRKVSEVGVTFQSHWDGSEHLLTPQKSIEIQKIIGSDIVMAFDECTPYPCEQSYAQESLERTTRWAERSKQAFAKDSPDYPNKHQLLFGIVQGSTYPDLRFESSKQLQTIGFDGYAIGGLAVGEPAEEMYKMLDVVVPSLPVDKPRYLMGVGKPENIIEAVKRGIDMFDCVIPTRNARHGVLYVWKDKEGLEYDTVRIFNEQYTTDMNVLDPLCSCFACAGGYTKAYIRHVFRIEEPLAMRLATSHNVRFYLDLMKRIRGS